MKANNAEQLPPLEVVIHQVSPELEGQRIDNYLMRTLKGVPKSKIYSILRKGEVRVNRKRVTPDYKLIAGDQIRIPPIRISERRDAFIGDKTLGAVESAILYEDEGLLVIDKPAGLAVHGGSGVDFGLIEALRKLRPHEAHLELVHRLDRDTSGCILIAKKRSVLKSLHDALRGDGVDKRYLALVHGKWPSHLREINAPLMKNELKSGERVVVVSNDGKASLTQFAVVERFGSVATLIEAKPVTGRTHQIRVHAQFAGHPLLGDPKYGVDAANEEILRRGLKRLFLHAASIEVYLPYLKRSMKFEASLPGELVKVLEVVKSTL